jgi:hypothetical protein
LQQSTSTHNGCHPPRSRSACTFEQSQTLQTAHPLQPSHSLPRGRTRVADSHPAHPLLWCFRHGSDCCRQAARSRDPSRSAGQGRSHWPEGKQPDSSSAPVIGREPSTLELPSFLTQQQSTLTRFSTPSMRHQALGSMRTVAATTVPGQLRQFSMRGPLLRPQTSAQAAPNYNARWPAIRSSWHASRISRLRCACTDIEGFLAGNAQGHPGTCFCAMHGARCYLRHTWRTVCMQLDLPCAPCAERYRHVFALVLRTDNELHEAPTEASCSSGSPSTF